MAEFAPGDRLGEYVILDLVGHGGMAEVYKAQHLRMKRVVALKVLPEKFSVPEMYERFQSEVEVTARLSHPNVLRAYDAGEQDKRYYLVAEYVNGCDLGYHVQRKGKLDVPEALAYILQAARGLAHVHENGVVHRDVKPANLILNEAGVVQVLDFGLAYFNDGLTRIEPSLLQNDPVIPEVTIQYGEPDCDSAASILFVYDRGAERSYRGLIVGTPAYMSPEQTCTSTVDRRSDIYNLGCTLHYLVTRMPMYMESSIARVLQAQRSAPAPDFYYGPRADVQSRVNSIFQRMVAKRPEDRFQSMAEVISEVQVVLLHLTTRPSIFLCYRREDSFDATHRLFEELAAHFGKEAVVMDIDTIPGGADFRTYLNDAVTSCGALLAIIGDHWLKARNEEGTRRLDEPGDFVRFEIATALEHQRAVIPVLVGRATMPASEDLPSSIEQLAYRQAMDIRSGQGYQNQLKALIARLEHLFEHKEGAGP